jgi:hypothetical protein
MEEIDINSFHCYFPGGGRRPEEWPGKGYPATWTKLVADLDHLIETHRLDVNALRNERNLMFQLNRRALSTAHSNIEHGMKLAEESSQHAKKMDAMILPFYRKMLKLGYSHEDLAN